VKRLPKVALVYLVVGAAILFIGIRLSSGGTSRHEIDLSAFQKAVANGEVATAQIKDHDNQVVGKLRNDSYRIAERIERPAPPPQSERPQQRPTARQPEGRPATPVSEYARKAAPQGHDPYGRSSPRHNLIEEDFLDIPAFLRRKAI